MKPQPPPKLERISIPNPPDPKFSARNSHVSCPSSAPVLYRYAANEARSSLRLYSATDPPSSNRTKSAALTVLREGNRTNNFSSLVLQRVGIKQVSTSFQRLVRRGMERKGSSENLLDTFVKSEMKKNSSYNDLQKEGSVRIDSGKPDPNADASVAVDSDTSKKLNPKKLLVFEGHLEDDLPPLNSKIVRIFTSSTFTGNALAVSVTQNYSAFSIVSSSAIEADFYEIW